MTEPITSKTSSRRNTPQSAPVHTTTGRSRMTRSRSHDISENDAPEGDNKAQRNPNRTNLDKAQQRTEGRANRNRKRPIPQEPDLSTVSEHLAVVADRGPRVNEADLTDDQDELPLPDPKAHGRVSGISGTTARTSGSAQEFNDLALEDLAVLDALPDLSDSTKKFLGGIVPGEISNKSLHGIRSRLQDKRSGLTRRANRFRVDLESCLHEQSSTFLDASSALPFLFGGEVDNDLLEQRPDPVFQAANLATLTHSLLLYPRQDSEQFLEQLDMTFPAHFANDASDTLELQLETRTQYAIMELSQHAHEPNFDHDLVLNHVFYHADGSTLRGFYFTARNSKESKSARKLTLQRLQTMRQSWNEENTTSPIEHLRNLYNWDKYVEQMMIWIQERDLDIQAQLDAMELEKVVQSLKMTIQAMGRVKQPPNSHADADTNSGEIDLSEFVAPAEAVNLPSQPDKIRAQEKRRDRELAGSGSLSLDSPRLRHGSEKMKRLNASYRLNSTANQVRTLDRHSLAAPGAGETSITKLAAQTATPHSQAAQKAPSSAPAKFPMDPLTLEETRPDVDDDWRPQEDDDQGIDDEDEEEDAFQTQNADEVLRLRAQRQAENNKENQAESSQGQVRKSLIDRQAGAERVSWGDSQELSQDVGFQQPHHRPSPHRQALKPLGKRNASEPLARIDRSPRKRARFQSAYLDEEEDEALASRAAPRPSRTYGIANESAKQMTAAQFKAPQSRKPWSEDEINTLFDLIERCGTSWALLKTEDRDRDFILRDRDQVALKDKARNIKFDFLKAGRRLPRNFDRIALSKIMIDKLEGLNIVYDKITGRREDAEE